MKKKKERAIDQGSMPKLMRWFIGPLSKHKPDQIEMKDWWEQLFHLKTRDIVQYECVKSFHMPGLYYAAAYVKVQGLGYRPVEPGSLLWARFDEAEPDLVQVENSAGQGSKEQVFALTRSEWNWVKLHVVEKERVRT